MATQIIDLPKSFYRVLPPSKLTVVATVAGVIIAAWAWGLWG